MARQNKNAARGDEKQTLLEHLSALRRVLLVSAAAIGILFVLVFYFAVDPLMGWILAPIEARGIEIIYPGYADSGCDQQSCVRGLWPPDFPRR